jgi:hypothetical protein
MRRLVAALLLGCTAFALVVSAGAASSAWQPVAHVRGVFDLGGPRTDGRFVVAGSGRLYLVDPAGASSPFAQGPGGYADDPGAEAYLAVSPGLHPGGPGCDFAPDDVYVLRLHAPIGVTRVSAEGVRSQFTTTPGLSSLGGIAFDTTGYFGHRLLVTGSSRSGLHELLAIDCNGAVSVITRAAPVSEGGMAVAPMGFGPFGGRLIVADEISGTIWAFASDGATEPVVSSGLPGGGDVGVEGVAFVPPGFLRGGSVYYADRSTPGGPHPGTDSVLRLTSTDLQAAGVEEGDLLAVTEGGMQMIAVRCADTCTVMPVVSAATGAHGEGHLVFTASSAPPPSPSPPAGATVSAVSPARSKGSQSPATLIAIIVVLVVLGAGGLAVLRGRLEPPGSGSAPPSR